MRNIIKLSILGITLSASLPAIAQQNTEGNWLVRGRAVNLAFQNGQADNIVTNVGKVEAADRWIPEVDVSYFLTKNIAAELVLTYPQNINMNINGTNKGTIKALPPSLLLQYHFTDFGAFKPYVGAGLNYTLFSKRSNILNGAARVDQNSFGLAAQVGLDYVISKNWSINFDAKYVQMNTDVSLTASGAKVGKVNLDPMLYGIGIGYRF
jgi:outer membrane protein